LSDTSEELPTLSDLTLPEIVVGAEYAAGPYCKRSPFDARARVRVVATGIPVSVGHGPNAHLLRDGVRVRVIEPAREGLLTRTLREYEIPRSAIATTWARWCTERARRNPGRS
jgi:hypothetical protein